ncbi:zinc metalloproteinase nas-14 [Nematostella vectensis]|uniref:zinc metalloproteinase nas-14 n=1 Tax=Nematostella vectensis TaxID=45351 RepID=UPI0020776A4C|nr:zinc metalloproteinase nas-14 [Nematostella vectensis]
MRAIWVLLFVGLAVANSNTLPEEPPDLYEGDIRPAPGDEFDYSNEGDVDGNSGASKRNAIRNRGSLWSGLVVPYVIDSQLDAEASAIEAAITQFNAASCLKWKPRTANEYYVRFIKDVGCWSYVGKIGFSDGYQSLSLGEGCTTSVGTMLHEMMHAVGFFHAQSRSDRNNYVEIMWENIQDGKEHNFNKYNKFDIDELSLPYDIESVMHYGNTYFSKNGKPTLQRIGNPSYPLGQRNGFSANDIEQLNRLYSCDVAAGGWSQWSSFTPCDDACMKTRQRFCRSLDSAACDAAIPNGVQQNTVACSSEECNAPVDGHWGRWSSWGACSKSCGDGTHVRTRLCDDSQAKNGGSGCVGDSSQSEACNLASCGLGPDDCEFNNGDCFWVPDPSSSASYWSRSPAGTPSGYTGPAGPRTGLGYYVYAEASQCAEGSAVRLMSKQFPATAGRCMSFYYYAYGLTYGSWNIYVRDSAGAMRKIYGKVGSQGEQWFKDSVSITSSTNYQVVFELVCGSNYASDLCIDDVMFTDGAC